jgi:hypothetical protein
MLTVSSVRTGLPILGLNKHRAAFEEFGFVIEDATVVRGLWHFVTLPEGWQLSQHGTGQFDVLDIKGRRRLSVDHDEHYIRVFTRFWLKLNWFQEGDHEYVQASVMNVDQPVYVTTARAYIGKFSNSYSQALDLVLEQTDSWFEANYPEHEDVAAYWD